MDLVLCRFQRSQKAVEDVVQGEPKDDTNHCRQHQPNPQSNQDCPLPPLDGGDDRRAAMRTRPRMVADLSAAFVTLDEGHNLLFWNSEWADCWVGTVIFKNNPIVIFVFIGLDK